jgi:hypothetical protein
LYSGIFEDVEEKTRRCGEDVGRCGQEDGRCGHPREDVREEEDKKTWRTRRRENEKTWTPTIAVADKWLFGVWWNRDMESIWNFPRPGELARAIGRRTVAGITTAGLAAISLNRKLR